MIKGKDLAIIIILTIVALLLLSGVLNGGIGVYTGHEGHPQHEHRLN